MIPVIPANVTAKAAAMWSEAIDKWGRTVTFKPIDGSPSIDCKAFCKRPKILGLFDRTEQSYDQERYVVMVNSSDLPSGVVKFDRIRWNNEDHAVISYTEVEMSGTLFGYRILVKG